MGRVILSIPMHLNILCNVCKNNNSFICNVHRLYKYKLNYVGINMRNILFAKIQIDCAVCKTKLREKTFYDWEDNVTIKNIIYDFSNMDIFE